MEATKIFIKTKCGCIPIILDEADIDLIKTKKWEIAKTYVYTRTKRDSLGHRETTYLHRLIMGVTDPSIFVDHINGNIYDNRRSNLRIVTKSQNAMNRIPNKNSTTGYKGVHPFRDAYRSRIKVNSKEIHLGVFKSKIAAAIAYDVAAELYHGEFARYNFPQITM